MTLPHTGAHPSETVDSSAGAPDLLSRIGPLNYATAAR